MGTSMNAVAGTIQSVIGTLKVAPPSHEVQQAVSVLEALKEKVIRLGAEFDIELAHAKAQGQPAPSAAPKAAAWAKPVYTVVPAKK